MPAMANDPRATLKAVLVPCAAFGASVVASVMLLFFTAVISAEWGARRTGDAMLVMLWADVLLFVGSALIVFLLLGRWVRGLGWRLLICGLYLLMSTGAMLVVLFMSAVALNR
jgi:hypothetical protein